MKREDLYILRDNYTIDMLENDFIRGDVEGVYTIIQELVDEVLYLKDRIDYQNTLLSAIDTVMKELNKENKKLNKKIKESEK